MAADDFDGKNTVIQGVSYPAEHETPPTGQEQEARTNAATAEIAIVAEPVKARKRNGLGIRVIALALCCALLGGAAGAGTLYAVNRSSGTATINMSGRTVQQVSIKTINNTDELSDAEIYAATVNSVVSINCSGAATNFFGQTVTSASSGSGFVLTNDGYIVTNAHVIEGASSVSVTLYSGESYDAAIVGSDTDYDVAVLKINAERLSAVTLGDSSTVNVGDSALVIGNPLGELTFSMSSGIISCANRTINVSGTPFDMIQIDTSINSGNSGGPLLNSYGEVIGIVSAKYSSYSTTSIEGLGFAIPINDVFSAIQDIMENGYVTNKAYFGISAGTVTRAIAAQYGVSQGVYVNSVES
ncbi:MAG: trypsin-like peptidase domain-containing protein, partial [Bacteroidales bacterium]|nr:trypsin-like peptidase domain-containing protein [Bacteroidales bacterium]